MRKRNSCTAAQSLMTASRALEMVDRPPTSSGSQIWTPGCAPSFRKTAPREMGVLGSARGNCYNDDFDESSAKHSSPRRLAASIHHHSFIFKEKKRRDEWTSACPFYW